MASLKSPVVYVVNKGGHDVTLAERFGDLEFLTEDKVNIFSTDRLIAEIKEKLKSFNPETDYLLLSGAILINILAIRILLNNGYKSINVLIYNFQAKKYIIRSI
jgi:hypothetical protein